MMMLLLLMNNRKRVAETQILGGIQARIPATFFFSGALAYASLRQRSEFVNRADLTNFSVDFCAK